MTVYELAKKLLEIPNQNIEVNLSMPITKAKHMTFDIDEDIFVYKDALRDINVVDGICVLKGE